MARYLPEDPVVVEAGAHRGFDTLTLARQWPGGTIHAFEPVPHIYEDMARRVTPCGNVRTYRAALASVSGSAEMFVSGGGGDQSSSLRAPKEHLVDLPEITFDETITVQTVSIDDWAAREDVERVDLFRLDLQGAELDALRGAERMLQTAVAIYTEVIATEQYEGAALYPALRDWLVSRGFRPEIEKLPWDGAGNVLFLR
jgi:FkbM family methyltransferase